MYEIIVCVCLSRFEFYIVFLKLILKATNLGFGFLEVTLIFMAAQLRIVLKIAWLLAFPSLGDTSGNKCDLSFLDERPMLPRGDGHLKSSQKLSLQPQTNY